MNYTGSMILFIFLVQLAAYTLKWLIGFGNPLISAPLLAMRLDNTLITPGSLLPDLVINGRITWQSRNNFRWRAILPLLLAMVAGVVPGTWLLRFSLPWIIKTVLGGVVVFLGLEMATRRLRPVRPDRREIPWLRYLVAFFSGMCAGLFGINMFLVAYLQRTAKDYDEFKGSICFLFLRRPAGPAPLPSHQRRAAAKAVHRVFPAGRRQHHREIRFAAYIRNAPAPFRCGSGFVLNPEQPSAVFPRHAGHFLRRHALPLRQFFDHIGEIPAVIPFAPHGYRSHIGSVRLHHDPLQRRHRRHLRGPLGVFIGDGAVTAQIPPPWASRSWTITGRSSSAASASCLRNTVC